MNQIPNRVNEKILAEVKSRLNPDLKKILLKVFGIHIFTAIITLSICPQMGFSIVKTKLNLMDLFMKIGPHFCDFACGIFFTMTSMAVICTVLSRDELRVLRFHKILLTLTIVLSSLGFLLMLSPDLFLSFSLLWLIGSISGIVLSVEIGSWALLTNRI
jgi:hypothetical protein